jgi:translation initiation factor 1
MEICPKCGLPIQACVCSEIGKSGQKIKVTTEKIKYGKIITMVSGFNKDIDIKKIAKELKQYLACGGTIKMDIIELQGDHTSRIKGALVKLGFNEELIEN